MRRPRMVLAMHLPSSCLPAGRSAASAVAAALALAACGGRSAAKISITAPSSPSSVAVGECADPSRDGVISKSPKVVRADRDLGGDGAAEQVVADRALCDGAGNCQWNIFVAARAPDDCVRYAGTLAAATLEPLATSGQLGMLDVRAYWKLPSGRTLVQEYRFTRGGYRVVDALLCRTGDDDRLECAEEEPLQ
jgi:hypothetical protein